MDRKLIMDSKWELYSLKQYIISEKREKRNTAGAKAPTDVVTICKNKGFAEFPMPQFPRNRGKLFQKIWLLLIGTYYWIKLKKVIEYNSIIVYQHPMYGARIINKILPWVQKKKHARFIALIHDLESLRGGIIGVTTISKKTNDAADRVLLKKFDAIICHNEHMREYLVEHGFAPERIHNLEIFDYLTKEVRAKPQKSDTPSIAIAGNLAIGKCAYIYNICTGGNNSNIKIHLYGINYQKEYAHNNMIYHGSFKPEVLSSKLEGDFGLVWDGNSADTCEGNTGYYLRYNNPHKTSLYLASGMPVIVWSKAAIADFVLNNGVGITIDSLVELEDKIKEIRPETYWDMCGKASDLGKKLRAGFYTQKAIQEVYDRQFLLDRSTYC